MRDLSRILFAAPLLALLVLVPSSCATTAGTSEVTDAEGEPVRVPVLFVNRSLGRFMVSVAGTELELVLPSQQVCVLLPPRVDRRQISLRNQGGEGGSYTVLPEQWSASPGWRVEVPVSGVTNRLNAFEGPPCDPQPTL